MAERVLAAQLRTRSLGKRKALDSGGDPGPRFKRGYVFTPCVSLSAQSTEPPSISSTYTAALLPSPPDRILNDPQIQASLAALSTYIKVSAPFDVDRLERILSTHPNQPFVASVIRSSTLR